MLPLLFAGLLPLVTPAGHGPFEAAGLYLVRVTAVEVPGHPKLYGDTKLRIHEVLTGPQRLKGVAANYRFFTPRGELVDVGGHRYSGIYPDSAYPAPKGSTRSWWAAPERNGNGRVTANSRSWGASSRPQGRGCS